MSKYLDVDSLSYSIFCAGLAAFLLNYLIYSPFFIVFVFLIPIFYIAFRIQNNHVDRVGAAKQDD